jgi:carbonic anhydrase
MTSTFSLRSSIPWVLAGFLAGALCPAPVRATEKAHDEAAPAAAPEAKRREPVAAPRIDALPDDESSRIPARRPAPLRLASAESVPAIDPLVGIGQRIAERARARAATPSGEIVVRVPARPAAGAAEHAPASPDERKRKSIVMAEAKPAVAHDAHWDYQGTQGPDAWAQLKPEFAQCSKGSRQSPIDIRGGIKVELDPVAFDYRATPFRVIDNGHTVQVAVGPGSFIETMGRRFELQQFHFHRPSEERVDGKQFDMVVHLVHKDLEGRLAVVAVLLERGSALPVVQQVWNNLPLEKGDEVAVRASLDPALLLPSDRSYFTYMGSLTTPPCSEGVLWMVMRSPVPISTDQIGVFARLYPMNARPLQAASGRLIKESN